MDNKVKFSAVIEQNGTMNAAYISFPFDVFELYGKKGQVKVKALFDNRVLYRGSLSRMSFPCHVLGMTKEIREKLGKSFGDTVDVIIEQDLEERIVDVPIDIIECLQLAPNLKVVFDAFSYSHKKEIVQWIDSAKKPETRANRILNLLKRLEEKATLKKR